MYFELDLMFPINIMLIKLSCKPLEMCREMGAIFPSVPHGSALRIILIAKDGIQ